jgi:stage III sporulation protein AE
MSVLSLCDAISDEMKMGRMLVAVKKIYAFFLGTIMTVLLSSLSAQTAISASADTTASRTARMLSGNFIPMVGGSIGETLRTVGGSVAYLKNVLGIGGIIMIGYILLPVGCSVLFMRVAFLLGSGVAELLGCSNEARFLGNLGEVYGSMLAVISGVSVMFILALCVFMKTVIAVA